MYVEDHGEPGAGADRVWFEALNHDGLTIIELSLTGDPQDNAETLEGGNIVVPHTPRGGGGKP